MRRRCLSLAGAWLTAWALLASGCGGDDAPGGCPAPITGAVTLGAEVGVVFESGALVTAADGRTTDLVCHRSGSGFDLKSGIPTTSTDRLPLHWFQSGGGKGQVFASLADVPLTEPGSADRNAYVNDPAPGHGFTVKNLKSGGWFTRVWVEAVDSEGVTLRYEIVYLCE